MSAILCAILRMWRPHVGTFHTYTFALQESYAQMRSCNLKQERSVRNIPGHFWRQAASGKRLPAASVARSSKDGKVAITGDNFILASLFNQYC
jgi:hypothetical protein